MAILFGKGRIAIFIMLVDELINFAKANHPGLAALSADSLRLMFLTYEKTTLIYREQGLIKGFAIYQEWPDRLNFIAICGPGENKIKTVSILLKGAEQLPDKMICFFDEEKMELKILCHK